MEMQHHDDITKQHSQKQHSHHYRKLIVMVILSFIVMYVLMYAMVDRFSNVFMNVNQFYMAALMASPMILIELLIMWSMYMNKKLNLLLVGVSILLTLTFFMLIRQQAAVGDKQFLKSMIPHHAGAILMCEESDIKDPEIKALCEKIRAGQQQEIDQMKNKLKELQK